jgi:pyruvate, orthophosphate dikinase
MSLLQETSVTLRLEFKKIFLLLHQKPVTIRLYDLKEQKESKHSAGQWNRFYTEFLSVQVQAVINAALAANTEGALVLPRLTLPFTASGECEMWQMAELIHSQVRAIIADSRSFSGETHEHGKAESGSCNPADIDCDSPLQYEVGVVLSTPRACLRARYIAAQASVRKTSLQYITFDTDTLTQLVWGLSDVAVAENASANHHAKVFSKANPFKTIDQQVRLLQNVLILICCCIYIIYYIFIVLFNSLYIFLSKQGVGELICMAKRMIRIENPSVTVGVFGRHTSDSNSVKFFDRIGVDNISCQGNAIPGAKVAAAQAHIQHLWCSHIASEDQYKHMPCDVSDILSDAGAATR